MKPIVNQQIDTILFQQSKIIKKQVYNLLENISENYKQDTLLKKYILNQTQLALELFEVISNNLSYVLQNKPYDLIAVLDENIKGLRV